MKGFTYEENKILPFVEIKLDGTALSIRELVKIAEQMRVELLDYGIDIKINGKKSENI